MIDATTPNLAIQTLRTWERACTYLGGSTYAWTDAQARTYQLLIDPQLDDGAIRGTVFRVTPARVTRAGSVLILPNGQIARAPKFLREVAP